MNRFDLLRRLTAFILPSRCYCCDKIVGTREYICSDCKDRLELVRRHNPKKTAIRGRVITCDNIFLYKDDEPSSSAVKLLKFSRRKHNAKPMAAEISKYIVSTGKSFDAVCAVPMTRKKKRLRGYNQSEELARHISNQTGIPFMPGLIIKIRDNSIQHKLNRKDRAKNVKGVYKADEGCRGLNILLIDDVVTTGATISECSAVLLDTGAKSVFPMAFASTI